MSLRGCAIAWFRSNVSFLWSIPQLSHVWPVPVVCFWRGVFCLPLYSVCFTSDSVGTYFSTVGYTILLLPLLEVRTVHWANGRIGLATRRCDNGQCLTSGSGNCICIEFAVGIHVWITTIVYNDDRNPPEQTTRGLLGLELGALSKSKGVKGVESITGYSILTFTHPQFLEILYRTILLDKHRLILIEGIR